MARKKAPGLDVWLYGHRVAHLTEPSTYRYKLAFTDEALDVFGQGMRVLSLALPFDTKAVADGKGMGARPVAAFLEGLLPEGNLRRHLAASLGVTAIDKLELSLLTTSLKGRFHKRRSPEFRTRCC